MLCSFNDYDSFKDCLLTRFSPWRGFIQGEATELGSFNRLQARDRVTKVEGTWMETYMQFVYWGGIYVVLYKLHVYLYEFRH